MVFFPFPWSVLVRGGTPHARARQRQGTRVPTRRRPLCFAAALSNASGLANPRPRPHALQTSAPQSHGPQSAAVSTPAQPLVSGQAVSSPRAVPVCGQPPRWPQLVVTRPQRAGWCDQQRRVEMRERASQRESEEPARFLVCCLLGHALWRRPVAVL